MEFNRKKRKNSTGSTLAFVLIIMTVVAIVLTSMISYITSQLKFSYNRAEKEKAFQIAESGIYYYRWYLAHQTFGRTAAEVATFLQTGGPMGFSPTAVDYEGMGKYQITVTPPAAGSTVIVVKSVGYSYAVPGMLRTVQVRFRRPSWSEYTFLSNSFMNFGNQAEVYGKIHSNGGIRFDGIAHNTVSSLLPSFNDPTYGGNRLQFGVHTTNNPADPNAPTYPWAAGTVPDRSDVFMGGRQFPVPEVSFTGITSDLANMKTQAQGGHGKYFDSTGLGRRITLKNDGTYDTCTVSSANVSSHSINDFIGVISGASGTYSNTNGNACTTSACCVAASCPYVQTNKANSGKCVTLSNYSIINDGVIFVENNVWVEGSINNKRVTLVAANLSGGGSKDLYIGISNSNLRYTAYDCNNMLGLVAQQNLLVLNDCPDDFIVDAALLAQTGMVGMNDHGFSGKNSLTFNGAIASYLQPYFQHGNSGFAERTYNFNNNLLYCPPPNFPTGTQYAIDLWEEL